MTWKFTPKQQEAMKVLAGSAINILLYGGSRSGKTFLFVRAVVMRALKAPRSRHVIFRFRFNHIYSSIVLDTFPKVMELAFPGVTYELNKSAMYATFQNGSEVWFAGLDDKTRTEKVLGQEYSTIYFNECSQIPASSVAYAITRLAQLVSTDIEGKDPEFLKLRAYYDANPPPRSHWLFKKFIQKLDPDTKEPLRHGEDYVAFGPMNPTDNLENLNPEYLKQLEGLPARMRKRFYDGEFADATPNALFPEEFIDAYRVLDGVVPDLTRVVVAVDPSGAGDTENEGNDAIGIVVAGIGTDGNAYLLEDCTVKAGPATWGRVATSAYERHKADIIVGEVNYGGEMVSQTIRVARPNTPFKRVTSSRGKVLRAEPFSALYEQGKVRHVGQFNELEDELLGFSTSGYTGTSSPNRADALVFALAELFPGLTSNRQEPIKVDFAPAPFSPSGWMLQ